MASMRPLLSCVLVVLHAPPVCGTFGSKEGTASLLADHVKRGTSARPCHGNRLRSESTSKCVKTPPGFDVSCQNEMNENRRCDKKDPLDTSNLNDFVATHCSKTCSNFTLFTTIGAGLFSDSLRWPDIPIGNQFSSEMNSLAAKIKDRYPDVGNTGVTATAFHTQWLKTVPLAKLRKDGKIAMDQYLATDTAAAEFIQAHTKAGDVVVHYRCGDVVSADDNWEYGLLPFEWVYRAIPAGTKRVHIVGNFGAKGIVARGKDEGAGTVCLPVLDGLLNYLKTSSSSSSKTHFEAVEFVSKSPMLDFLLLANAPTVIGSVSTFPLGAAWLNPGHTILPWCHLFGLKLGVVIGAVGTDSAESPMAAGVVETLRAAILTSGNASWIENTGELVKVLGASAKQNRGLYHDCASTEKRPEGHQERLFGELI
jgi:hypothetical protein